MATSVQALAPASEFAMAILPNGTQGFSTSFQSGSNSGFGVKSATRILRDAGESATVHAGLSRHCTNRRESRSSLVQVNRNHS